MEISIQSDEITLRENVEVFGELEEHEKKVGDEEYEVKISTNGYIPISDLIEVENTEGGETESVRLCFDEIEHVSASVRKASQEKEQRERTQKMLSSNEEPPEPPEVNDFSNPTRRQFYHRLVNNRTSQPAIMRRIIFQEGKITKKSLKERMVNKGYEPESGGFGASLVVLSDVTNEVKRSGRGEEEIITWVGD